MRTSLTAPCSFFTSAKRMGQTLLVLSALGLVHVGCGSDVETTSSGAGGQTASTSGANGGMAGSVASAGGMGGMGASGGAGGGAGGQMTPGPVGDVYAQKTFEVKETKDVVFGQALVHQNWGDKDGTPFDLLLDVYEPIRDNPEPMPVVVVIHGGGFVGGTKSHGPLSTMARSFAERGWVGFSIDYRLAKNKGTLPDNYPDFPGGTDKQGEQFRALYPACRDAKAAIRWIRANASTYAVSPDHVTAIGGSAGSFISVALGVTDEDDCVGEVTADKDPTLAGTHLGQSSRVQTIIDHWGGTAIVNMLELMGGMPRFDATDAPISIVHGTEDPTVSFTQAEALRSAYQMTGVDFAFYPLEGKGHGPWGANVEGKSLSRLAFDFIVKSQKLSVK